MPTSGATSSAVLASIEPLITAAGKEAGTLAADLFAVVDTLDSSGSLRRALTDPARPGTGKATLVADLFGGFSSRSADVVNAFVSARWSKAADLADALEAAGIESLIAAAQAQGKLDDVEEELFRVERLLAADRPLRVALDDRTGGPAARLTLLNTVFAKAVGAPTFALLSRAVTSPRGTRLSVAIPEFIDVAAARRERAVAHVTAAVELTAAQRKRLQTILATAYGREIQLNVAVEPSVLGGIRVQVGHEMVDGTVLSRLDEVRQKIGG